MGKAHSQSSPRPRPRPSSHRHAQQRLALDEYRSHSPDHPRDSAPDSVPPHHRPSDQLHVISLFQPSSWPEREHKVLVSVTVAASVGPLRFFVSPEFTVKDIIQQALQDYDHEGRIPALGLDSSQFDLHYTANALQPLNPEWKVGDLGARQFFLCSKKQKTGLDFTQKPVQQLAAGEEWRKWWVLLVELFQLGFSATRTRATIRSWKSMAEMVD